MNERRPEHPEPSGPSGSSDSSGGSGPTGSSSPSGPTRRLPLLEKAPHDFDQSASAAAYHPVLTTEENDSRGRLWSERRVPAAVVTLLVLGGCGVFLYDLAARRADRSTLAWRERLAHELAERPLDDPWVLLGAGAAVLLGLWLLVLAATPGRRSLLAMRSGDPDVRAWLHRDAAALVLRDRAMEVSGVRSVRVRVRRSAVDVRAVAHFRELDDVRADLDTNLGEAIAELGLARAPGLSVRVQRPARSARKG